MQLQICGISEIPNMLKRFFPTHIISLLDADQKTKIDLRKYAKHYVEFFDDIESGPTAPQPKQIGKILKLTESLLPEDRLLVHCHAGLSRSTATALGVLLQRTNNEKDALQYLFNVRPIAIPNKTIVKYIDRMFGTKVWPFLKRWEPIRQPLWLEIYEAHRDEDKSKLRKLALDQLDLLDQLF